MKHWNSRSIADGEAPTSIARIARAVMLELGDGDRGSPKLQRIGRHDRDSDYVRYEVDVELAPGVVLPTEHGLVECIGEEWEDTGDDEERIVALTTASVAACLPHVEKLSDLLHDARRRARETIAFWRDEGLPGRLVDVSLAPCETWQDGGPPQMRIVVDGLGENLQPEIEILETGPTRDLDQTLSELHDRFAALVRKRDVLMRQGATGTINQLALNAIGHFGDVAATLRRFGTEWRFWLPDDTCILMSAGAADAGSGGGEGVLTWIREGFSATTEVHLLMDPAAAVGRPVTELVGHPFLSPDMIVEKASWTLDDGGDRHLVVKLHMPWRLFCSTTGRIWDASSPNGRPGAPIPIVSRSI